MLSNACSEYSRVKKITRREFSTNDCRKTVDTRIKLIKAFVYSFFIHIAFEK